MDEKNDKKKINLCLSREIYKKLQLKIVEKYGSTYGHIGETIEEAIKLWIYEQSQMVI